MLRKLHSLPGLLAGLLVAFMAITGSLLSLQPVLEHFGTASLGKAGTVAELASRVVASHPEVQRIVRTASGSTIAYSAGSGGPAADLVDPATGASLGSYQPSAFFSFLTELHRSLFLGKGGEIAATVGALALVVLSVSGMLLLVSRLGGWRKLLATARGSLKSRLHVEIGRLAIAGLMLSALTGLYMAMVSLGVVSDGSAPFGNFPPAGSGGTPAAIASLAALQGTPLSDLRELTFPAVGDTGDVFSLTTASGEGFVDQATGEMLSFTANTLGQSVYEFFFMLHTGNGLWWVGLLLGFSALAVPVLAVTGTLTWWARMRQRPRLIGNVAARQADVVILVGSEGNTTWGFASSLHAALTEAGRRVHTASMNQLASSYPKAQQLFVLTSTHGDGQPPANANRFLSRLARHKRAPQFDVAVLGFGDRSFQHFAAFAAKVDDAVAAKGWHRLLPLTTIDRQSAQAFAAWGDKVGEALGLPLHLHHVPERPRTARLELIERTDYGIELQAPTVVLRFALPEGQSLPKYAAGDLFRILPPGSLVPRYYSVASETREGFVEICVRKQIGGLCSEFLHGLEIGDEIEGFVRSNPDFRPARGRRPVVMIANGAGIAPFAGFIKANRRKRPAYLYWGGRSPDADFLYADAMAECLSDGRLTDRMTAFSRSADRAYVQDRLLDDSDRIRALVASGAQFMICGSKEMAAGVADAINAVLAPIGLDIDTLKLKGRYLEDVY